jgi:uncharacterized protein involved in exopolysaccharide biosynthesis
MSTHDNRLIPVPALDRGLDRSLNDLNQNKGYGVKGYGVIGNEPASLKDYLHIVLKRKWLILSLVLVVTSLVAIQSFRAPSIYEGETTIRIEQKPNILQTDKIVINGQNDPNFWGTQLKLLQNPALARQVVLQLDLPHNPAFFGGGSQSGFFDSLRRIFSSKPKAETENKAATGGLSLVTEPQNNVGRLTPEEIAKLEVYEDAIIAGETIEPIPNTNLVRIIYRHSDPELAQKIANTLAEVFKNYNLAIATEGSNKAEDLLANEIAKLQAQNTQDQEILWNFAKNRNLSLQLGGSQSL